MLRNPTYFRNFVFGVEDSLVSTVGLLSGVAITNTPGSTILLIGVVLIFVEAFSMGVGSFLSESSAEEYAREQDGRIDQRSALGGVVMFFSYLVAGLVPLWPYALLAPGVAFGTSITSSIVALFLLGLISARVSGTHLLRGAVRMAILGGAAIVVGVVVGMFMKTTI